MIAARQIAFGKVAGKRLPYDVEVEYLESTGTQYIDTGFTPDSLCAINATIAWTNRPSVAYQMGVSIKNGLYQSLFALQGGLNHVWYWDGTAGVDQITTPEKLNTRISYEWNMYKGFVRIDSSRKNIGQTEYTKCDGSFFVFVRNSVTTINPITNCFARCYGLTIEKESALVRDFIPVRKGNIGYMYDRVSGELFGNLGTGAFIIGPDVASANGGGIIADV